MMKKTISNLVFGVILLALGSCNGTSSLDLSSSSVPSVSSEDSLTTSEVSSTSMDDHSSSETSYVLDQVYTSATWPQDAIEFVIEGLGVSVPNFISENEFLFMLVEDEDGLYVTISTEVATIASEEVYSDILRDNFWIIDETYYEEYGFFALDSTGKVEIQYYWYEGEFVWYIYPALGGENSSEPGSEDIPSEEQSTLWPSSAIASFLGAEITVEIPSLASPTPYFYGVAVEEDFEYFFVYTEIAATEMASGYFDVEETYNSYLTTAGWTIDAVDYDEYGFYAIDPSEKVVLQYYWWDGYFQWIVMHYEPVEALPGEVAVDGVATFNLLNENALVIKDANTSVWVVAPASMTIAKGTATVNVGNGSFFSNPLRIYQNQGVTFAVESGYQIDSIVIEVNAESYVTVLTSSTFTNATYSSNGLFVTLTPASVPQPVQILLSAQTRFTSVVIHLSQI